MKISTLILSAFALLAFTGCSSNDDSAANPNPSTPVVNALEATASDLTPSGDTMTTSLVVAHEFCAGDTCAVAADEGWQDVWDHYTGLEEDVAVLSGIDSIVETSNGTYDLYDGDTLMMTLSPSGDGWDITASAADINITDVMFQNVSEQDQSAMNALQFTLQACAVEQEQEQEQEGKEQEQEGKDQEQAQDKRGNAQEQEGKDEAAQEEVKEQDCETFTVVLFAEQEQEKEQEQEVKEEKEQEQEQEKEQEQEGKDQTAQEQEAN